MMKVLSQADAGAHIGPLDPKAGGRIIPRILVSIPNGFQLRQLVHSRVLALLINQGYRVVIASPSRKGEGFTTELPSDVEVFTVTSEAGSLRKRYFAARQHFLANGLSTNTLRQKMADLRRRRPSVALAAGVGVVLGRLVPPLRRKVLQGERYILRDKTIDELLSRAQIDLILLGTPGYVLQDALLLHAAADRDIPVVAAVMSWDNLSSKGLINPIPDSLLVWSEHMRREAVSLQGVPADRVVATGSPIHDVFANPGRFGSRADNLKRLGIDLTRRLIFYGTNHAGFFPDEFKVVERVARWVEEDAFGVPCQLWVRLHPLAVAGPYQVKIDAFRRLASARVKVELPEVRNSSLLWDLASNDLEHLAGLLRDADVVINTGSTLAIDAAILDRPVICIAYDPDGERPYEQSIRRYYDFTHMSTVVKAGAVRLAKSPEKLRQAVVNYLNNPSLDREGRQRIVEQHFGKIDGCSAARFVQMIQQMVPSPREPGRSLPL
jgi:hypothetical protein